MSGFSKQIQELNLTSVIARLQRETSLSAEVLTQAETQYRQFLQLCRDDTGTVPTELADKVWHTHILDTRKYAADCEALFGQFMHHTPHSQITPALEAAALKTQKVWAEKFGENTDKAALCNRFVLCNR